MSKRRAAGEGSVFRRRDGRWVAAYIGLANDGTQRRKFVYARTRAEVVERLQALKRDVSNGIPLPARSVLLSEYLADWLKAARPSLRPKTYVSYEGVVRLHITPILGHVPLERLTAAHVGALLERKQTQGLSPRTSRYVGLILRNALNKAVRWGLLSRNVAALVDLPREVHREVRVLSPPEARRLVDAARGDRLEALWLLSVSTGLRMGEVLALQWSDVDLDRRELRVTKALQRVSGRGLMLAETKTRRSRRTIVLPVAVAEALRWQRTRQELEGIDSGFVFTSSRGTPIDGRDLGRSFRRLLQRADITKMRFHDLRHSCASLLLAQGISPRVVMETLGHSRIAVTMDTYAHVMPALQREAADAMDRLLEPDVGR